MSPRTSLDRESGTPQTPVRGWIAQGIAALTVSVLGLAVAGSLTLTSQAQPSGWPNDVLALPLSAPEQEGNTIEAFEPPAISDAYDASGNSHRREQVARRAASLSKVQLAVAEEAQRIEAKERDTALDQTRHRTRVTEVMIIQAKQRAEADAKFARELALANARADAEARQHATNSPESSTFAESLNSQPSAGQNSPPATQPGAESVTPSGNGGVRPIRGGIITAGFGAVGSWSRYHTGDDFRAAYGTAIYAAQSGVVVFAGNTGNWAGNHVAVRHPNGMTTMYSHMSSMAASTGSVVKAGQVIGYVGQTGRAFGAHLHFELYPAGVKHGDVYRAINPVPWLRSIGAM